MTTDLTAPIQRAERIGPYRILQVLGEGGMGIVYEAEETDSVRRRVALKVVRDRHASKEVLARFEIERQALAVMNHPAIAKVFAAGTTPEGQPYFAMELVRGLPFTQYCDEHRLSVRERLELFVAVCHGVQHAHQKGVIHRDLKPSNILVTEADGVPEPRIIDFGIAKALGQQLTDLTLVTQFGNAVGTAAYMSPEQAESGGADIDTRSDVYSLGVLMYEMLVGELPSDPGSIGIHAYLARLMARESDPPTPSVRVGSMRLDPTVVAKARRTDIPQLKRELQGDLDWIVMKAMEPDRNRRYATANALAVDLQHYLSNEPITARPPTAMYRLGKFVRRNRVAAAAIGLGMLAILAGTAFSTVGMIRARRAEQAAAKEAEAARQVTQFLINIFKISSPSEAQGEEIRARVLLDRGAAQIKTSLADQPELQSRLLHVMGTVYTSLGLYAPARTMLEDALRQREELYGPNDIRVAATLAELGTAVTQRGEYADAERFLERAAEIDARTEPTLTSAEILGSLAILRMRQGRYAAAESLYRRLHPLNAEVREPGDPALSRDLMGLGLVYMAQGKLAEAEPLMRQALATQEATLGESHPETAATLNNLGALDWYQGDYRGALAHYERTRRIYERIHPATHPDLAANANNLAETYWKLGRFAESESLFTRALRVKEQTLTATHPDVATTLNGLAGLLRDQRRHAEAEPLYRRALAIREQAFGAGHASVIETRRDYAALLRETGRPAEAAAMEPR